MTARIVTDIVPIRSFHALMANLTNRSVDIHKGMNMALATDMPGKIVTLVDGANFGKGTEICKLRVSEHLYFKGQLDGSIEKKLEEPTDWRDEENVSPNLENEKDKVMNMFSKFESIWYGTLGTVKGAVHRIELEPGSRPIH